MYQSRPKTGFRSKNRPNLGPNNNNFNSSHTNFRRTFFIQEKIKVILILDQQELVHAEE